MALLPKAPCSTVSQRENTQIFKKQCFCFGNVNNNSNNVVFSRPKCLAPVVLSMSSTTSGSKNLNIPIMVNSCTGKMGKAVIKAVDSIGLQLVPVSFGSEVCSGQTIEVCGKEILVHGHSDRESVLASVYDKYPNMIVVDYTVPDAVNDNAELYCKVGVPFVMGTTGGDRDKLYEAVKNSKVYAMISPQMAKMAVEFLASMEKRVKEIPRAYPGCSLQVLEFYQTCKEDTSRTWNLKDEVSSAIDQMQKLRYFKRQLEMVLIQKEDLASHPLYIYQLALLNHSLSFEFEHIASSRSIAEATVDAVIFLSKMVQAQADKRIYNMKDVFNMR